MTRLLVAARLCLLVAAYALMAPLQAAAIRLGWSLRDRLPVLFHRLFLALFEVRVIERGPPPRGRATLVVANHVSWLDISVIGSLCPVSFIAKSEVAGWPFAGTLARLQRTVFIDRRRRGATAEVNAAVAGRLSAGEVIVLFAEGTTGDGNRVLPFRSSLLGAAEAAVRSGAARGVDLQPLALAYTRRSGLPLTRRERPQIAWYGDMDLAPHLGALLAGGPVDVVVSWGEPFVFDGDRKRAAARAEAAVRTAVREASAPPPKGQLLPAEREIRGKRGAREDARGVLSGPLSP